MRTHPWAWRNEQDEQSQLNSALRPSWQVPSQPEEMNKMDYNMDFIVFYNKHFQEELIFCKLERVSRQAGQSLLSLPRVGPQSSLSNAKHTTLHSLESFAEINIKLWKA